MTMKIRQTSKADNSLQSSFPWPLLTMTITTSLVCKMTAYFRYNNKEKKNLQCRMLRTWKADFRPAEYKWVKTDKVAFFCWYSPAVKEGRPSTEQLGFSPCWQDSALPKCPWARYWSCCCCWGNKYRITLWWDYFSKPIIWFISFVGTWITSSNII